ncbi:MAG: Sec-independent protein translocase subunit TatA/TatB [Anaerolineaceae bacterium]
MQILGGIGFSEIIFILILMVIILGPKKMVEGARDLGKTIRKVTHSQFWKDAVKTSREIRDIPRKIIDEAEIEDEVKEINRALNPDFNKTISGHTRTPVFKSQEDQTDKSEKPPQP